MKSWDQSVWKKMGLMLISVHRVVWDDSWVCTFRNTSDEPWTYDASSLQQALRSLVRCDPAFALMGEQGTFYNTMPQKPVVGPGGSFSLKIFLDLSSKLTTETN